jgi:FlhB-like protein
MPEDKIPNEAGALAVAMKYAMGAKAPRIVAKGRGRTAERIVKLAAEHGVEIVRDGSLAAAIFPVELGDYVPERFYEAVARIFAFIWTIEGRK